MSTKLKINRKFFDRYTYKICRDNDGRYQPYLKHKRWFKWHPLHEYAEKLPLMFDEIKAIERQFIKGRSDSYSTIINKTDGCTSVDNAKEVLNAFIHCINAVVNEQDEPEVGTLTEFLVIENI